VKPGLSQVAGLFFCAATIGTDLWVPPSRFLVAPAPYSETGMLGPDDLKRWKKPEKPIELTTCSVTDAL
jgi:hypothetical protein